MVHINSIGYYLDRKCHRNKMKIIHLSGAGVKCNHKEALYLFIVCLQLIASITKGVSNKN